MTRFAEMGLPFDDALLAIDMLYVLGPGETLVAEAAARARATLTRLKAAPVLELMDDALAHGAHEPAGARGPTGPGVGSARSRTSSAAPAPAPEPGA